MRHETVEQRLSTGDAVPYKGAESKKGRQHTGTMAAVVDTVTIIFALYAIAYLSGILHWLNVYVYGGFHTALVFTFALVLAFLNIPATKNAPRDRLPWYDAIAAVLSLVGGLYVAVNAETIAAEGYSSLLNPFSMTLGLMTIALVLEAARRAVSPILSILGLLFFLYPLFADYAPGFLERPPVGLSRAVGVQYLLPYGMFGSITHVIATMVLAFLIFGAFIQASGAGKAIIELSLSIAGRFRGGPAKVAVAASALLASMSGSSLSNVAVTGTFTIPLMKSVGYRPTFAGAVEAVASNGGSLTPPVMGASIFIMMDFLGVSYATLMVASLLPVVVYYLGLLTMVHLEAVRTGLRGLPTQEIPQFRQALRGSWYIMMPLVVLVFFLVILHYGPATSALYATASLVLFSLLRKETRIGSRRLRQALAGVSYGLPQIGMAVGVAGLMMGAVHLTGVALTLGMELVNLSHGNMWFLLVLTGVACMILGMGLSGLAVYLMGAIFLAPSLIDMGANPIAAHLFVYWVGHTALITPPVCSAAFLAATIAEAPLMATGWLSCRLGIAIYLVPFIWVFNPALLMIGTAGHVVMAAITVLLGVTLLSCSVVGRLLRPASWVERLLFLCSGILLMVPGWTTDIIGIATAMFPLLWQMRGVRFFPSWKVNRPDDSDIITR